MNWSWHKEWNYCARANLHFKKKKKKAQAGNEWSYILPKSHHKLSRYACYWLFCFDCVVSSRVNQPFTCDLVSYVLKWCRENFPVWFVLRGLRAFGGVLKLKNWLTHRSFTRRQSVSLGHMAKFSRHQSSEPMLSIIRKKLERHFRDIKVRSQCYP